MPRRESSWSWVPRSTTSAAVHHQDVVGLGGLVEAVRHHQRRSAVGDLIGGILQRFGSGRARFGGGFVHDDDGRVEEQDPGQRQLLCGDRFQLETAGADHGVET